MGGGGSKSKSTIDVLNDASVNVVQQLINVCTGGVSQDFVLKIVNTGGTIDLSGATISQSSQVDLKCALSSQKKSDIAYTVANQLSNTAEANGTLVSLPWGQTKSQAVTHLTNIFNTQLQNLTENKVSALIKQRMNVEIFNVDGDILMQGINISQSAKVVAQSITDDLMQTGVYHNLSNAIDQKTKSDQSVFGSLFGDLSLTTIIFIVVGILIFIVIISFVLIYNKKL